MKKIIISLLLIASLFILTSCNSSSVFNFNLGGDGYLTMATSADYPPYENIVRENGKTTVVGADIEIAKEIAKSNNKNLRVIHKSFDFLISDLSSQKVDIVLASITPTPSRENVVSFSTSYEDIEVRQIVVIKDTNKDKFDTLEKMNVNTVKIAAQSGSLQQELVQEYLGNATPLFKEDIRDLFYDLSTDKCDAIVTEFAVFETYKQTYKNLVDQFDLDSSKWSGVCVAVAKNDPKGLLPSINSTIDRLKLENKITEWIAKYSDYTPAEKGFSFLLNSDNIVLLLKGILLTLILSAIAVCFGSLLGLIPALFRTSGNKILRVGATIYVDIIRGTPILVQVLIFYELLNIPLILFLGIDLGSLLPGIIALVINSSAYVSEIIRGGINSVDIGQTEASLCLGMTKSQTMKKVILPQAIKNIVPSLGNEFVTIIKETSIFMYLGVAELMFQIGIIKSQTFAVIETYIVAGLLYLLLTIPLSKLISRFEKRKGVKSNAK